MGKAYDSSWDDAGNRDAWDRKCAEWEGRDWLSWLKCNLTFPFTAAKEENVDIDAHRSRRVARMMEVLEIEDEDEMVGVLVYVKEGKMTDCVPLCEIEVKPKADKNFWHVREYAVWFANRWHEGGLEMTERKPTEPPIRS